MNKFLIINLLFFSSKYVLIFLTFNSANQILPSKRSNSIEQTYREKKQKIETECLPLVQDLKSTIFNDIVESYVKNCTTTDQYQQVTNKINILRSVNHGFKQDIDECLKKINERHQTCKFKGLDLEYKLALFFVIAKNTSITKGDLGKNYFLSQEENFERFIKPFIDIQTQVYKARQAEEVLSSALEKGYKNLARIIIKKHKIDFHDNYCKCAFLESVEAGYKDLVEIFINNHIDLNSQIFYRGKTALMFAAEKGFNEILEILINNGADLNLQDENGKTALLFAIEKKIKNQ